MSNQLLPCPFCGCEVRVNLVDVAYHPFHAACVLSETGFNAESWNYRATQPAAGEPVAPIGYANPKHLARMSAGHMGSVSVLAERSPDENHTAPVFAAAPAAAPVAAGDPVAFSTEHGSLFWHGSPQDWKGKPVQLYLAPPAAAHGDEAVLWELLDTSVNGEDEQQIMARAKIRHLVAMRAQAGEVKNG